MTRRELREHCFKMLFCADFYPAEETKQQLEQYFEAPEEDDTTPEGEIQILHQVDMDEKDRVYLTGKAGKALDKLVELDARINNVAEGWKTRRMGKVELTILRLALYEILYDEEIPEKVAINEAVELAKKFGGDDSSSFINGVLAKIVKGETGEKAGAQEAKGSDAVSRQREGKDLNAVSGKREGKISIAISRRGDRKAPDAASRQKDGKAPDAASRQKDGKVSDVVSRQEDRKEPDVTSP